MSILRRAASGTGRPATGAAFFVPCPVDSNQQTAYHVSMKNKPKTLAERLREFCEAKQVSLEEVAARTGAKYQTVRTWAMKDGPAPAPKFIRPLADVLGCDPTDLLP
jgi:hypothetical protein